MLISDKAIRNSYDADLRAAVCACLMANQRTRTTDFVLPVRDAVEADCRNDVEQWPHSVSAAGASQTIVGEVGREGGVALLIQGDSSVERAYLFNISTLLGTAIERLWPLAYALLRSAGMFAVRKRRSLCPD